MASFEEQVEAACVAGDLPGVVLVASGTKGNLLIKSVSSLLHQPNMLSSRRLLVPESLRAKITHRGYGYQRHIHLGLVHEAHDIHRGASVR
jgi:hypothetical protein